MSNRIFLDLFLLKIKEYFYLILLLASTMFSFDLENHIDSLNLVYTSNQLSIWNELKTYGDAPELLESDTVYNRKIVVYTDSTLDSTLNPIDSTYVYHYITSDTTYKENLLRIVDQVSNRHGVIALIKKYFSPYETDTDKQDSLKIYCPSEWYDTVQVIEETIIN